MAELVDHPNDVENIAFEVEFEWLMIADTKDADADITLGQHEEGTRQMLLSTDDVDLDGMTVPLPPQPPPEQNCNTSDKWFNLHSGHVQPWCTMKDNSGRQATKSLTE